MDNVVYVNAFPFCVYTCTTHTNIFIASYVMSSHEQEKKREKMAASNKTSAGGYKCEFVQPYTEDFVCKICKYVAREFSLTTCCGETFCQSCISQVLEDKNPCPSCKEDRFATFQNPKYQRRILALEVCCTMKDRGCDWRAKLEHLEAHLDINTGECEYVDIECPNKCKQAVQKREMTNHLTNDCPKRDFYCQHCNFKATHEVVCDTHWPECKNYPVQCPNACMVGAVERGDLDDHLKQCSLQEVECEFSYAGCKERLERQHMERHMQESTQKHLAMMSAATLRMSREFEQKLQEQREEFRGFLERKERETAELLQKKDEELDQKLRDKDEKNTAVQTQLQDKDKENEGRITDLERKFQERNKKIENMEKALFCPIIPVVLTAPNATRETQIKGGVYVTWDSPTMSTHCHGYELSIQVCYNYTFTYVGVRVCSMVGNYDDQLKWPVTCTITVQLLNQHQDKDHVTASKRLAWDKPTGRNSLGWISFRLHPISDLGWNAQNQTQYLKDDCLKIKVTEIVIH